MSAPAVGDGWPAAEAGLERHYRRLLRAYPGSYRRRHGAEMVTTMLDMAAPGQHRPTASQVVNLLACGVRQRFRLPAGRPLTILVAVLVSVVLAALGAGAGSWLGWQAAPATTDATVHRLAALVSGQPDRGTINRWTDTAYFTELVTTEPRAQLGWTGEQARARLLADGWWVGQVITQTGSLHYDDNRTAAPTTVQRVEFTAAKGDLALRVEGMPDRRDRWVSLDLWAAEPATATPLALFGLVVGAALGWLLTAAAAYRLAGGPPVRRRTVAALTGLALAALTVPTVAIHRQLLRVLEPSAVGDLPFAVHSAFRSTEHLSPGVTPALTLAGVLAGIAAVAVAVGANRGGGHVQPRQGALRSD